MKIEKRAHKRFSFKFSLNPNFLFGDLTEKKKLASQVYILVPKGISDFAGY